MTEKEILTHCGIRVSQQRIKILSQLKNKHMGFTVKELHWELMAEGGVSFSSVYNFLSVLERVGLVKRLNSGSTREYAYKRMDNTSK